MQSTLPIQLDATRDIKDLPRTLTGRVLLAVAASAFVAICAHISVPLYFTPVPITLQTFAVILIGLTLGPTLGFSALALYLAEGAAGLPVFSPLAGVGGASQLVGPTAGYLFSYPIAAAVAGAVVRIIRSDRAQAPAALLGGIVASLFIFTMGAGWLAHILHASPAAAWHMAIMPFLPGETLKITAAATAYTSLRRWHRS